MYILNSDVQMQSSNTIPGVLKVWSRSSSFSISGELVRNAKSWDPHANALNQKLWGRAQQSVLTNLQVILMHAKVWESLYYLILSQGKVLNKLFLIQAFMEIYPTYKVFTDDY